MLTESYTDEFIAIATCTAGLTGLLFVAISVRPRDSAARRPAVIQQIRAASALLAFTNALAVSLFGVVRAPVRRIRRRAHLRDRPDLE